MPRTYRIAALILLSGPALWAQKRAAEPRPEPSPRAADNGNGQKPVPKLANPTTDFQVLMRMTPEQRERALEKFPPARQAAIRERLQKFDALSKQEQERRLQLGEIFAGLPPENQDLVRRQIQAANQLPDDRRRMVLNQFQRLRRMSEEGRQRVLDSPQFRNRFSPAEQQMISDLSRNLPVPSSAQPVQP
jgi:hypothetical protein